MSKYTKLLLLLVILECWLSGTSALNPSVPPQTAPAQNPYTHSLYVTDRELEDISFELHRTDVRIGQGLRLNLQRDSSNRNHQFRSLFDAVPSTVFTRNTVKTMMDLFDNYEADVKIHELITSKEIQENDAFLTAVTRTAVTRRAHAFLAMKGYAHPQMSNFKQQLRTIWFGRYSRARGVEGSSGFEHYFVGEIDRTILGLHSWLRFADEEKKNKIDYLGYVNTRILGQNIIVGLRMQWRGLTKNYNSVLIGVSPELELALCTICFLTRPGTDCPLRGSNKKDYSIQTYAMRYKGVDYLGSAYPVV